jgi:hypothetical protein
VLELPTSREVPRRGQLDHYHAIDANIRRGSRPTVYWNVLAVGPHRRIIQYWTYYLYNDWNNKHEGDWESVQVDVVGLNPILRIPGTEPKPTIAPIRLFYSAHGRGAVGLCPEDCRHPIVYVAAGSHANYFRAGKYRVELTCEFNGFCVAVPGGVDDAPGTDALDPSGYALERLSDDPYPGRYGVKNKIPLHRDGEAPEDPRTRPEWKANPLYSFVKAPGLEPDPRRWSQLSLSDLLSEAQAPH